MPDRNKVATILCMEFIDQIKILAERAKELAEQVSTEEATKNALIMPFLKALGYDVFDPTEVIPEFTADVATKQGEKVDYAVKINGQIEMLWECKKSSVPLEKKHVDQLYRYFSVTKARIAVLSNGVQYQFFSDIDAENKMDACPFLQIDLLKCREDRIAKLETLTKSKFDREHMLAEASELKIMSSVRSFLEEQFSDPSDDFIKLCHSAANPNGRLNKARKEQFSAIAKKVLQQLISDKVSDRLRKAIERESPSDSSKHDSDEESNSIDSSKQVCDSGVITTEEEQEAFLMIRGLLRSICGAERVVMRDTKSYCGILLDDNNRKPICRLHLDKKRKFVEIFEKGKKGERFDIESICQIHGLEQRFIAAARSYDAIPDQIEDGASRAYGASHETKCAV